MSLLDSDDWTHTIDLARRVVGNDSYAGTTVSAGSNYQSGLAAWIQPATDNQIKEFAGRGMKVTHQVYLTENPSPGVFLGDILIAHGGTYEGMRLEIISFRQDDAGFDLLFKMMCNVYEQTAPS